MASDKTILRRIAVSFDGGAAQSCLYCSFFNRCCSVLRYIDSRDEQNRQKEQPANTVNGN